MSRELAVFALSGQAPAIEGARLVEASSSAALATALAAPGWDAAVLVSEGLVPADLAALAAAVTAAGRPVIEVPFARWDGESYSPLSAACRGVISGFGAAGIAAALEVLRTDWRS